VTPPDAWPPGRPRVLVTESWLANAGDAAITLGVNTMVRQLAPTAAILHASYQRAEVGPLLPGLRFVPPLEDLLGSPWHGPLASWDGAGRELVTGADLVICQAGGAFTEPYQPWARLPPLATVADLGIPLVVLGASIGPFVRTAARRDLGRILRAARLVTVRDPLSLTVATELGAPDAVFGSDLALALFDAPTPPSERSGISVILTDHHPREDLKPLVRQAARDILQQVVHQAWGRDIHLWSTVQGLAQAARENDADIGRDLLDSLNGAGSSVTAVQDYVDPLAAIRRVASSEAVVTMRLHPALFAACTGTPFALVLHGQRTGVLDGARLEDRVASPFEPESIRRVVGLTLESEASPTDLWGAMAPLRLRLADTAERLGAIIVAL
jgi:polysaccharide pyruvyl transferase WcaK-like protein